MRSPMTPHSMYLQGYKDGYEGAIVWKPNDPNYMHGYSTGKEDDQFGMPNRYCEDKVENW